VTVSAQAYSKHSPPYGTADWVRMSEERWAKFNQALRSAAKVRRGAAAHRRSCEARSHHRQGER
jgi:hypothetical protein